MDISLLFKHWYLLRKQKSESFYPDNWPLTKWNRKISAKVHRHLVEPEQNHLFLRPRCQIIIFCAIATGVRQCQLTLWSAAAAPDHLDKLQINLEIWPNLYFFSAQRQTHSRNEKGFDQTKSEVRPIPRISFFGYWASVSVRIFVMGNVAHLRIKGRWRGAGGGCNVYKFS